MATPSLPVRWKPFSDADFNAVALGNFPGGLRIVDANGNLVEQGFDAGGSNGYPDTIRFSKPGYAYTGMYLETGGQRYALGNNAGIDAGIGVMISLPAAGSAGATSQTQGQTADTGSELVGGGLTPTGQMAALYGANKGAKMIWPKIAGKFGGETAAQTAATHTTGMSDGLRSMFTKLTGRFAPSASGSVQLTSPGMPVSTATQNIGGQVAGAPAGAAMGFNPYIPAAMLAFAMWSQGQDDKKRMATAKRYMDAVERSGGVGNKIHESKSSDYFGLDNEGDYYVNHAGQRDKNIGRNLGYGDGPARTLQGMWEYDMPGRYGHSGGFLSDGRVAREYRGAGPDAAATIDKRVIDVVAPMYDWQASMPKFQQNDAAVEAQQKWIEKNPPPVKLTDIARKVVDKKSGNVSYIGMNDPIPRRHELAPTPAPAKPKTKPGQARNNTNPWVQSEADMK